MRLPTDSVLDTEQFHLEVIIMAKVVKNNTSAANTLNAEEKFRLFLAGE